MIVGVDVGGTFTDLVMNHEGRLHIHKLLSTPANPAEAMLAGLRAVIPDGVEGWQVAHGTTVATNAILERKGGRVALITTQGFRDVLRIGRQNRPVLYALSPQLPAPIIPAEWCFEVPERLDHRGEVLVPLNMKALDQVLDQLVSLRLDAIAVCFLYSYANTTHEEAVRARIVERRMLADWQVAISSEVLPEFREYERASTVALEAYVRPVMTRYVEDLVNNLPPGVPLRLMKSDGGMMRAERVRTSAVHTALSGPAAGVIGAYHIGRLAGFDHLITLDMGGTSTDVALLPGEVSLSPNSQIDGLPLRVRLLDIETIGAGGGSIARLDAGGALRVGPQSAGAEPGPAIYGRGGQAVTVSDANAILGRLEPQYFLGGRMTLDLDAALGVFATLAGRARLDVVDTARGVIDVANASIERAVRRVSVARGRDPRDFTLMAFGGAGPLHGCQVAERLDIPRILIPRYPGVLCALGLLVAEVLIDTSLPVLAPATPSVVTQLQAAIDDLIAGGRASLAEEGVAQDAMQFRVVLDARYSGQAHELVIGWAEDVAAEFHQAHTIAYGYALEDRLIEIVNVRVQAIGPGPALAWEPEKKGKPDASPARIGDKPSPLGETLVLYDRERLKPGMAFDGPALVCQLDSTAYIPAGWQVSVDAYRNLIGERR